MSYKKLRKDELLDIIEELEQEAKDSQEVADHVAKGIKDALKAKGYDDRYLNRCSFYDLGDEMEEITAAVEEYMENDGITELIPIPESLGEMNELKEKLNKAGVLCQTSL